MTLSAVEALKALVVSYEARHCDLPERLGDHVEADTMHLAQHFGHINGAPTLSDLRAACEVEKEIATQVYMDDFGVLHLDLHKEDLEPWLGKRLKVVLREVRS